MYKTWQARDQPKKELEELLRKRYNDIEKSFNILKKLSNKETAHKMIDEIFAIKEFCTEIELELLRRSWNDGTSNEN